MSAGISLKEMEAAARVCAADMWTLRGVWDAYGLWFNTISLPMYQGMKFEEQYWRRIARTRWREYVMQEREKRRLN